MRVILYLAVLLLVGCQSLSIRSADEVQHVVLVWFNEDISEQHIAQAVSESYVLQQKIPLIKRIRIGDAIPSDRKMVDDSFDIGLVMSFDSLADLRTYEQHPEHKAFLKQYIKGRVARVQIYDF